MGNTIGYSGILAEEDLLPITSGHRVSEAEMWANYSINMDIDFSMIYIALEILVLTYNLEKEQTFCTISLAFLLSFSL